MFLFDIYVALSDFHTVNQGTSPNKLFSMPRMHACGPLHQGDKVYVDKTGNSIIICMHAHMYICTYAYINFLYLH